MQSGTNVDDDPSCEASPEMHIPARGSLVSAGVDDGSRQQNHMEIQPSPPPRSTTFQLPCNPRSSVLPMKRPALFSMADSATKRQVSDGSLIRNASQRTPLVDPSSATNTAFLNDGHTPASLNRMASRSDTDPTYSDSSLDDFVFITPIAGIATPGATPQPCAWQPTTPNNTSLHQVPHINSYI